MKNNFTSMIRQKLSYDLMSNGIEYDYRVLKSGGCLFSAKRNIKVPAIFHVSVNGNVFADYDASKIQNRDALKLFHYRYLKSRPDIVRVYYGRKFATKAVQHNQML